MQTEETTALPEISNSALPTHLVKGDRVFHIPTGLAVEVTYAFWDQSGERRYTCRFPKGAEITVLHSALGGLVIHDAP